MRSKQDLTVGKSDVQQRHPFGHGSKPMGSHFGIGAPRSLVYFSENWDVHWGYWLLTHSHFF